jgi:hypothetical protein
MSPVTNVWDSGAWVEVSEGGAPYVPSLTPVYGEVWYPSPPYTINPGTGSNAPTIDASDEWVAWIFQIPRDGTITNVGFRGGALTTNPSVVDCRLETVDASGLPSGTLIATGANGSQSINASNSWWNPALTTPPTVNQGDWVALKIAWTSGNTGIQRGPDAGNVTFNAGIYGVNRFGGSNSRFSNTPFPFGLQYSDSGIYANMPGVNSYSGLLTTNYTSSSNPDERGIRIDMPIACQAAGMWFCRGTGTGDRTLKLYDSANTVLWSLALDPDYGNSTNPIVMLMFDQFIDLDVDTYRLTCLATSGGNVNLNQLSIVGFQGLYHGPGGAFVQYTTRNDGGAWTDNAGASASMGLLLNGIMV